MKKFKKIERGMIEWFDDTKYLYCSKEKDIDSPINMTTKIANLGYKAMTNFPSKLLPPPKEIKKILEGFIKKCDLLGFNFNFSWIWSPKDNKGEYCIIPVLYVNENNYESMIKKNEKLKKLATQAQSLKGKVLGIGISPVFVFPIYFCLNEQIADYLREIYYEENESYFIPTIIDIKSKRVIEKKTSLIQSIFTETNWVKKSNIPEYIGF